MPRRHTMRRAKADHVIKASKKYGLQFMINREQYFITLPVIVVHRGKLYRLSETARRGLVLQQADSSQNSLDIPRGSCCILAVSKRVALRGSRRRSPSHSPGRS